MTDLKGLKLGVALCGSFCTFKRAMLMLQSLVDLGIDVYPIMSTNAYTISTRFGKAEDFIEQIENITGKPVIHSILGAEPLGPKNIIDALLIAPCTGNTLAKLANGITDTPVLMATKSHLRNNRPVVIALSTNDALGMNLKNIGILLNTKNIYFVPFGQDDYKAKPNSLVTHFDLLCDTISFALNKEQIQPLIQPFLS